MRQRIWRQLISAAAGVLVLASLATAQQPTAPSLLPAIPQAPAGAIMPVPVRPVTLSPAAAAGNPIAPVGGSVRVPGEPGKVRTFVMAGGGYCSNCPLAQQSCSNGCGSIGSDATFVFGSCKSFFSPCGPNMGLGSKTKCGGAGVFGHGGTGYNGCQYDSYLNH